MLYHLYTKGRLKLLSDGLFDYRRNCIVKSKKK